MNDYSSFFPAGMRQALKRVEQIQERLRQLEGVSPQSTNQSPDTIEKTASEKGQANPAPGTEFERLLSARLNPAGETSAAGGFSANQPFEGMIRQSAERYGLDPHLVRAVVRAESNFKPNAVSRSGARGLMQLMPATAKILGVKDSFDPGQNIDGGSRYLRDMLTKFDRDPRLALAAYNAGPGNVRKYGGIPPFPETQAYVRKVLGFYENYKNNHA